MPSPPNMTYLATPYSSRWPWVRWWRWLRACWAVHYFMSRGHLVFSPIAHCHMAAVFGLPGHWEFWARYDNEMIERCDAVMVFMLSGWEESRGIQAEVQLAARYEKPVYYVEPGTYRVCAVAAVDVAPSANGKCAHCGVPLTADEAKHYGTGCEGCEAALGAYERVH